MEDDLELNIYRLIQEQMNNIMKHAEANKVKVSLEATGNKLVMQVIDNGKGFDTKQKRTGIGISNMLNRIESFNGEMRIVSEPGEGCKIETVIPP